MKNRSWRSKEIEQELNKSCRNLKEKDEGVSELTIKFDAT